MHVQLLLSIKVLVVIAKVEDGVLATACGIMLKAKDPELEHLTLKVKELTQKSLEMEAKFSIKEDGGNISIEARPDRSIFKCITKRETNEKSES